MTQERRDYTQRQCGDRRKGIGYFEICTRQNIRRINIRRIQIPLTNYNPGLASLLFFHRP